MAAVGCLVERYRDELAAEVPEVDLWCGLDMAPLLAALTEAGGEADAASGRIVAVPVPRRARPVSAYIKVSDGSDRRCQFAPSTTNVCPEMKRAYGDARNVAAQPSSWT